MNPDNSHDRSGGTSIRVLAELARAGSSLLQQPNNQAAVEVHHVRDRPGYLREVLTRAPRPTGSPTVRSPVWRSPFTETLSASAYGAGLMIGIRTLPIGSTPAAGLLDAADPVEPVPPGDRVRYGMAVPNLAFSFDTGSEFEGLISIDIKPVTPEPSHARVLLLVIQEISEIAVNVAKAPILYLQSPVQLPLSAPPRDERMSPSHADPAWALAVRFGIALSPPTAELRLRIADALASFCAERGLGLWLADGRPGRRPGNWFEVCPHDRDRGSEFVAKMSGRVSPVPVAAHVPFTLVGPARTGAVHTVSSFLKDVPEVGIAGCSSTTIHDLDFIHLQLTSAELTPGHQRLDAALEPAPPTEPHQLLRLVAAALCPGGERALPQHDKLAVGTAGYQAFAGPVQPLQPGNGADRIALWVSWELEGHTAEFAPPFMSLYGALEDVGLLRSGEDKRPDQAAGANVEYLICRRVRRSIRGKGKVSLPRGAFSSQLDLAALAERIEDAWAIRLGQVRPARELTVSFWEYWLGHWTSPV